jgi:DNA polymerase-1
VDHITIDFETKKIEDRPKYPPEPVGVAIAVPGSKPIYAAFGHKTGNNCTFEHARDLVRSVYADGRRVLCHNGEFDMEVAQVHMGLPLLSEDRWDDSMLTAYLRDPHSRTLRLKDLAETRLGIVPEERDRLKDWILENVPGATKTTWAEHIADAPGTLVGEYAVGDVTRTEELFDVDYAYVQEFGMQAAYEREKKLIPIFLENSQAGVTVDLHRLEKEVPLYEKQMQTVDAWIYKKLGRKDFNIDSTDQLAAALDSSGIVDDDDWLPTPGGKRSTSKASLAHAIKDPVLVGVMLYRGALKTCLNTFMSPWLARARETGGRVNIHWNSTRQDQQNRGGSRTGRVSSSPNFQNIYSDENLEKADKGRLAGWFALPKVRSFIIADTTDDVLLDRDFRQQELRVLAHYEDGAMKQAYLDDPDLDLHDYARDVIEREAGIELKRKATKVIAFGLIYGMGIDKLAASLDVDPDQAKATKQAYLNTFPGIKELMDDLKYRSRTNQFLRTWGGRIYFVEPARILKNGQRKEYGYKLLNYLIQGSSADLTKEALIRYHSAKKEGRFLLTVHDELMVNAPHGAWKEEMKILRDCMGGLELDVPLYSDGEYGYKWFDMKECE